MLKNILGFLVLKLMEWLYQKFNNYAELKATINKQRKKIEQLKQQLTDAETEVERKDATKSMAEFLDS